ncbi:MAG: hypothetical protein NTY77_09450 [Elusimicrobia bacterium]|nr:hypothetical protein [Elusimicrobiota bacterium]
MAKVGDDRRKKKGGAFWHSGAGAAGRSGGGGIWGSVSGIMSQSALKIVVTLLAGAVGVGAYNAGKGLRPDESKFERKPQLFASKNEKPKYEGDLSKLPGGTVSGQNSVTMVSGSLDGLTAEERAARAAKAEADAKAAAEAQAKADAEAKAKEEANVPAGPDPSALAAAQAAAAEKEKAAAFSRKFGELSKGGSGLSGGGGMAGGIGQGFAQVKPNPGAAGALSTLGSKRMGAGSSSSRISTGRNPGRSLAQRQLNRAVQGARQMKAGANETRSDASRVPFDTGSGDSQLLSGSGGGLGGGPRAGAKDSNPSSGGGGGSGAPVGAGGNVGSGGPDDCGTLASQYGWHGDFVNSADGGCVLKQGNVAGTGKDDPTNQYFDMLKILSLIATILSVFLLLAGFLQKSVVPATMMLGFAMAKVCGVMLCAVGALIAILGLMVAGMGRKPEGTIFAIMGTLTSIAGYMAYASADKASADAKAVESAGKEQTAAERTFMDQGGHASGNTGYGISNPNGLTEAQTSSMANLPSSTTGASITANQGVMSAGNTSLGMGSLGTGSNLYGDFHNVDPRHWNPDTQQWD